MQVRQNGQTRYMLTARCWYAAGNHQIPMQALLRRGPIPSQVTCNRKRTSTSSSHDSHSHVPVTPFTWAATT